MTTRKANPLMEKIKEEFPKKLELLYSVSPEEASDKQVYYVLSAIIVELLGAKRQSFINQARLNNSSNNSSRSFRPQR